MGFGDKLRMCRTALELSQQQLADLVDSTKQIVSLYEKGERIPKVTTAARYAEAVHVPLKYLITDSVNMRLWESDDFLEDYWRASPPDKLRIVTQRGIDPRIAADYEKVSALAQLAKTEKTAAGEGDGLSPLEKRLMQLVHRLSDDQKEMLLAQIELLLSKQG